MISNNKNKTQRCTTPMLTDFSRKRKERKEEEKNKNGNENDAAQVKTLEANECNEL